MIINPYIFASTNPLLDDLYAVYKAESNADDSLGTYNGTAVGGLTYASGKSGNAFVGNGTNAYVSLPNNSLSSLTGEFSISVWISTVHSGVLQCILSSIRRDAGNYYGISLYVSNTARAWFQIMKGAPTAVELLETTAIPATTWTHIVAVRTSTGSKIYRNGVVTASNSSTQNAVFHPTLDNYCSIGAQQNTPSYQYYLSNGTKPDELMIYNKALTSDEVTELYNSGTGKFYPTF